MSINREHRETLKGLKGVTTALEGLTRVCAALNDNLVALERRRVEELERKRNRIDREFEFYGALLKDRREGKLD